jgi:CIC family chloride channel protein
MSETAAYPRHLRDGSRVVSLSARWLRGNVAGLLVMALVVGLVAGIGAVGFRYLIYAFTWLATGHIHPLSGVNPSDHLPFLGHWFYLIIPIVGGAIYGPLIYRFAREARGHGVPEVMIAVAEHGGRIRPRVSFVKAVASALCIGVGGSVGREGPIVQIGSAFGSTIGQWVRMSETRVRLLVSCGAAGGIAATFNAPMTGVFFGFELILREFSIESLFAIFVSSVAANVVSQQFFGAQPFFPHFPHHLIAHHVYEYLLVALLGVIAGLIGVGFKTVLYKVEDACDRVWKQRPEWARPAFGGVALGVLLLLLPQMYGVGYPVMGNVVGDSSHFALWFLIVLMVGKMVAASLTIGIGGSGGVFAPSLFTGAMAGTAFGVIVHGIFGSAVGPPALYGMVAMGAVFASAAQAPLTSLASVVEMTGDFALTLPVMLAVGISAAVSKKLTHGTIYTTKLLRRGTDIDRPTPSSVFHRVSVSEAMQPLPAASDGGHPSHPVLAQSREHAVIRAGGDGAVDWESVAGPVLRSRKPQVLFSDETLIQGLRQLVLYGRDGLPVTSSDSHRLIGWITNANVLAAVNQRLEASVAETEQGQLAADFAENDPESKLHRPKTPLRGYEILEITVNPHTAAADNTVGGTRWPEGSLIVATTHRGKTIAADDETRLVPGDRITVLTPAPEDEPAAQQAPRDKRQAG